MPGEEDPQPVRCKTRPRDYKDGEEFSPYINHFERVAAANGWADATKLVQLETLLKGKAQRDFEAFIHRIFVTRRGFLQFFWFQFFIDEVSHFTFINIISVPSSFLQSSSFILQTHFVHLIQ